jgi:diguanylate cyclase
VEVDGQKHMADQWAKKALDGLKANDLAPTPDNFAVFYAYHAGSNPNLAMAMDTLIKEFGKLSQLQCTEIFLAHLSLEAENKVLSATTSSIEDEIKRVMTALGQTASGAQAYNQTLTNFSGTLQATVSLEDVRAAVSRVASETRVMAEQNQRLHSQLAQSTQQLTEMRYSLDQVRKDSMLDPLTEVGNRKYFDKEIARATTESMETGTPLALLMVDIDHFKKFNDTYGHLIGDQVLRLVAHTLIENLKGRDIIARYGGEEFVILLPNTTVQDSEKVANQLRNSLATKQIKRKRTNESLGIVTISLGATSYVPNEDFDSFIARADAALYDAKQTGRNKVMSRVAEHISA